MNVEVESFMKQHKGEWFYSNDIAKKVGVSIGTAIKALRLIVYWGELKVKVDYKRSRLYSYARE